MSDIKLCPFCRSANVTFVKKEVRTDGYYGVILCIDCKSSTGIGSHKEMERRWNFASDCVETELQFQRDEGWIQ